jgi:class 3 adenylate cyclase
MPNRPPAHLAILGAISELDVVLTRAKLLPRIGIDSGAVVIGEGAGKEIDAFGDPPNIAARVHAIHNASSPRNMSSDERHR